ncbi:uncharacterized protein LOC110445798 [Mizuhopecten yessoensis]|uniref:CUB domain-containing protein 2 n=1 Tax=Mizuhopecten yessoensis TaxID=6573 RepID=A0A210QZ06_MIZYE|nr:uncharacterized protein LOC110445798 [Mizuhopecten yessoensis]OWF53925.1 CUB domain-containing protein 2 [Mizuhopecten yessoensis]
MAGAFSVFGLKMSAVKLDRRCYCNAALLVVLTLVKEPTTVQGQNTTLVATSTAAYFMSEGYPTMYSNNVTYTWLLESNEVNEVVKVEVVDCQLEYINAKVPVCQLDTLTIYDGAYENATQLYSSCCITSVPAMNSSGTSLLIKFYTDSTVVARGFRIKFYNSAAMDETSLAAASGLFIAIGIVVVLVVGGAFLSAYFIYRFKCQDGNKLRINPLGEEGQPGCQEADNGVNNPALSEYEKRPLDGPGCSAPTPKAWTETGGMEDPSMENMERNVFVKEKFPAAPQQPNTLPPHTNSTLPSTNELSAGSPERSLSPVG